MLWISFKKSNWIITKKNLKSWNICTQSNDHFSDVIDGKGAIVWKSLTYTLSGGTINTSLATYYECCRVIKPSPLCWLRSNLDCAVWWLDVSFYENLIGCCQAQLLCFCRSFKGCFFTPSPFPRCGAETEVRLHMSHWTCLPSTVFVSIATTSYHSTRLKKTSHRHLSYTLQTENMLWILILFGKLFCCFEYRKYFPLLFPTLHYNFFLSIIGGQQFLKSISRWSNSSRR